jgi:hypothetical protein
MKRKVGLLQQPLLDSKIGPNKLIQAETIPQGNNKCPQDIPTPGKNWGKTNVPTVIRKGTGRMTVPNRPGTPKRLPRLEAEDRL